jgi:hypothetical protein
MHAGKWGRSLVSDIVSDVKSRLNLPPQPGSEAGGSLSVGTTGGLYNPPLEEGDAVEVRT